MKKLRKKILTVVVAVAVALAFMPVIGGNSYEANAAGMGGITLDFLAPIENYNPSEVYNGKDFTKLTTDLPTTMSAQGFCTSATGEWSKLNGATNFHFLKGNTYMYTATLEGGFPQALAEEGGAENMIFFGENSPQLYDVTAIFTDETCTTLIITGFYDFIPEIAELVNFRNTTPEYAGKVDFGQAYVGFGLSETGEYDGVIIYIDGKPAKDFRNESTRLFIPIKIPYGGKHYVTAQPYIEYDGNIYWGKETAAVEVSSPQLKAGNVIATKITSSKVRLSWNNVPGASGYKIYAGGTLIKTITSPGTVHYVYSKTGAAKKTYYFCPYYKDGTGTYDSAKKKVPVSANKYSSTFKPGPSYYGYTAKTYAEINKLYYSKANSKGKLKAKIHVTSTFKICKTKKAKVTLTVKSQGKTIAKQSFIVKNVPTWGSKDYTVTFKNCKTGYDLTSLGGCKITKKVTRIN